MAARFCEVALPLPLRKTFTYAIPDALAETVAPGSRVLVPVKRRVLVGAVMSVTDRRPAVKGIREIIEVLDPLPALPPQLVELGRWVASYYLAPPGDVSRAMLPPQVEVRQRRELRITPAGRERMQELKTHGERSEDEVADLALLELIEVESRPVESRAVSKLPGAVAAMTRLLRRGEIEAHEVALHRKERVQRIVAWNPAPPEVLPAEAKPKRRPVPEEKLERLRRVLSDERGPLPLPRLVEEAGVSRPVIERLIREGKLKAWDEPVAPGAEEDFFEADFAPPVNTLNAEQEHALSEITSWLDAGVFTVGLLHGVTGSGKTEVYLRAIEAALARGRTALVLVPEIALTLWVSRLCRVRFGEDAVAVLHSALPDPERAREWWRVRRGDARVVVGTRSAVFAPLEKLGLVIVDEEQEASYKQEESPRYNGRDTAIVRAKNENAVALLASATPALETYQNARAGKYKLLELKERVASRPLATVEVVDMREDFRRTEKAGPISGRLREAIAERLAAATQALVLINRRGYSWFALCRACGATVGCENCSISLVYHKGNDRLVCHYCGFNRAVPKTCPKCASEHIYFVGEGSERLEERLAEMFPRARIARLDRDTTRTKRDYQRVLGAFAAGKLDVLVGTQMVAKGHDFQRVTLVGILGADQGLGLPDFRAAERSFHLFTQVAGRAGRGTLPGTVLLETFYPEHYAIQCAARQDYGEFFEKELHFRRLMHYPPFVALASILVRDAKLERAAKWARQIGHALARYDKEGVRVLGPATAPIARLKREYRFQFLVKSPKRSELTRALAAVLKFCDEKEIPPTAVIVDVDPQRLM